MDDVTIRYEPGQLADLESIRALSAVYARGLDRFDMTEIMSIFTPDAVFDATPVGLEVYQGAAAIEAFFGHNQQVMGDQIHLFSNFVIEFGDPDSASGTNYLWQDGHTKDGSRVHTVAFNEDEYVRTADGWRLAKRTCSPLLPPQLDAY
jgi:prepilin-type processing-associated H-X9-DG protein